MSTKQRYVQSICLSRIIVYGYIFEPMLWKQMNTSFPIQFWEKKLRFSNIYKFKILVSEKEIFFESHGCYPMSQELILL